MILEETVLGIIWGLIEVLLTPVWNWNCTISPTLAWTLFGENLRTAFSVDET